MQVRFSKRFSKSYDKSDKKIKNAFKNRLSIFKKDQHNPQLNNHTLTGKYLGYRSINVTGDWRAIYSHRKIGGENVIIFEVLGTHSQLYK